MSLNRKILNGSIWSLIGNSSYQASGLIIFIILSRILTPVDFGTAALAIVFVELSNVIVRYGSVEVVVRNTKASDDVIENSAFTVTLLLGFVACILFMILSPYLELLFDAPGLAISLQILSVVPLMQALSSTPEGILKREFKFKALAIRLLCSAVFSGGIAIYLAYNDFGFYSLIIQKVISTAILLALVWKSVQWRPRLNSSYLQLIDILKQGQPIVLSSLIGTSIFRFIELIVGYFLGVAALGYLKVASKLLDAIVQFTIKPIVDVSFSAFADLKDSPVKLQECYLNFINTASLFSFPAFIGALVIGPDIVNLIFGKQWETSGIIFSILCLGGVSASLNYFFSQLCHATHNSHIPFRIRIIEFIVIIALVSLSSQFSIYYVAYSTVLVAALISIVMVFILKRTFLFSVSRIFKGIITSLISALFMGAVVYLSLQTQLNNLDTILKVIVSIAVGCITYALFYRVVFPKKTSDIIVNIKALRK